VPEPVLEDYVADLTTEEAGNLASSPDVAVGPQGSVVAGTHKCDDARPDVDDEVKPVTRHRLRAEPSQERVSGLDALESDPSGLLKQKRVNASAGLLTCGSGERLARKLVTAEIGKGRTEIRQSEGLGDGE
jgi:hypothetical protein